MKHIIVTLTILNTGDEPAYVLRAAYSARQHGTTVRDQFDVMEACGRDAPYHAFTTDEDVLSESDFQRIEPGGTFEQKLDLTGVYDIGPGGPVKFQYVVPLVRGSDGSLRAGRGMRESDEDVQGMVTSNPLVFLAPHVDYKSVWWPQAM